MADETEDTESIEIENVNGEPASANQNQDLQKAKADYLYLAAEFDNYKKNAIKERSELLRYGGERLVRELLNVVDNFERALETETTAENFHSFRQGVQMTSAELRATLQKFGIEEVDCIGKPFDPMVHEAIGAEETDSYEPGFISRVLKKAFKYHDRLLRPAQVIVAKPPSQKQE